MSAAPGKLRIAAVERTDEAPATVDAWLDVFERMLRLPPAQKDAVREELRSHLTERVRDLMLAGAERERAMREAVNELGEAAELAERFRHANRYPRRRLIMNGAIIGLGAAAIVTAAAFVSTNNASTLLEPSIFEEPARAAQADALKALTIDVTTDMSARQIVAAIAETKKLGVSVDWSSLEQIGFAADEPLGISGKDVTVMLVLNEISRRADAAWNTVDWRLEDRMLTIDRKDVFAMRERMLASYDIDPILETMLDRYALQYDEATEQVSAVIQELIDAEQWDVNGGNIAQLRVVSGRMFVYAPLRTHEQVSWMLSELSKGDGGPALDPRMEKSSLPEPSVMPNPTAAERARLAENQVAMARLRHIFMAWLTWAQIHEKEQLASVQQLVEGGMLRAHDTTSPYGPASDGDDYWLDYANLDPGHDAALAQRIIGVDRAMYESCEQVAILFADGHIELQSAAELHNRLAQPANADAKPDLPRRQVRAPALRVQQHSLLYTSAEDLATLLNGALGGHTEVFADVSTNSLLAAVPESRADSWQALLTRLDSAAQGK